MLLLATLALANGLTSHVTISEFAVDEDLDTPQGGLDDIVRDPDLWLQLQNGSQFPDGGYPLGEAYAETAHWEPFQDRYLDWIRETYGEDWSSTEARQHLAFLLGMGSHGMGDQVFDSLYMQRAYVYDAESDWENLSMDQATDVGLAAQTGGQQTLDAWVPWSEMVQLMGEAGVEVSEDTLREGQDLTRIAITFGRVAGADPDIQEQWRDAFPWAYDHILDWEADGSPPWEAAVVAEYWKVRWARLHGELAENEPLIYHFPYPGYDHPTDASTVEARVSAVLSRGVVADLIGPDLFTVEDEEGNDYVVDPWVFYGNGSHVIHLVPQQDWPDDTWFTVTVHAGVPFIDGTASEADASFWFTTGPMPTEDPGHSQSACACGPQAATPAGLSALLPLLALRRRAPPASRVRVPSRG